MHVAAGRGVRGVDVGVGVDPDDADLLLAAAIEVGDAGDRACGQRVVAAQHQRSFAFFQRGQHGLGGARAGFGNLGQVTGIAAAVGARLCNFDADVTGIGDAMAESLEPGFEAGHAHG